MAGKELVSCLANVYKFLFLYFLATDHKYGVTEKKVHHEQRYE